MTERPYKHILGKSMFPEGLEVYVRATHSGKRIINSDTDLSDNVLEAFANGSSKVVVSFSTPSSLAMHESSLNYDLVSDRTLIHMHAGTSEQTPSPTIVRELKYVRKRDSEYVKATKSDPGYSKKK